MCSGFLWYNYLVALNSFRLCLYSTSSSTEAPQWINELLVTSGTFPLKSSLAPCDLIPLQGSSWEKVREWMSSRDVAELPREHIFTLVLFLRDLTWGKAELLAVPPTEHSSQAGREFFPWCGSWWCVVLSSPFLPQGGVGNRAPWANKWLLLPVCHSGFFLNVFVVFLIAKDSSCSLLSFISFFKIIYYLPYLPNLAFAQCVCVFF